MIADSTHMAYVERIYSTGLSDGKPETQPSEYFFDEIDRDGLYFDSSEIWFPKIRGSLGGRSVLRESPGAVRNLMNGQLVLLSDWSRESSGKHFSFSDASGFGIVELMPNVFYSGVELDSSSEVDDVKISTALEKLYSLSLDGDSVRLLREVFDIVETSILKDDFPFLNEILDALDLTRLQDIALLSLARATGRGKSKLPAWQGFVVKIWLKLSATNSDVSRRMRGLVNSNDSALFASTKSAS